MLNNKLNQLQGKRMKYRQAISGVQEAIDKIKNDKSMLSQDRKDLSEHKAGQVFKDVYNALDDMAAEYAAIQKVAEANYKLASRLDSTDIRTRAAVLTPALTSASDDELLNLLKSRAGERIDRAIVEDMLRLRIDSRPAEQAEVLLYKYENIRERTINQLPESERNALQELNQAQELGEYLKAATTEAIMLEGALKKPLNSQEVVSLKMAQHILDQMELGRQVNPANYEPEESELLPIQ